MNGTLFLVQSTVSLKYLEGKMVSELEYIVLEKESYIVHLSETATYISMIW